MKLFTDRREGGRALAVHLSEFAGRSDVVVLALPRGGVPVGFEVASALQVPLDVLSVRKLGAPRNEEYAIGAIASGGLIYVDELVCRELGITSEELDEIIAREAQELSRRDRLYRGQRPVPLLSGMCVILVDDGLATGSTMVAAVMAVRKSNPAALIAAAPVASREACDALARIADRVVAATIPDLFSGVGLWYDDFNDTSDEEVLELVEEAAAGYVGRGDA